ncbi:hypothetical protein [Desulfovibrio aminophilus]|jgi:hypothetical protein|uniref:hypothetical protein n=1 Tax=Desulfovibrio aminophilus TaxID=81425 RepID=UPI00041A8679|nr:hypothetical protein [Desulfovibrio aminophilus]MCM0755471.1 hypothetical protein [Desulfovibrio aminophilus]MDY0307659.1 hypothetical protein [Desulfovibrionaceae bacterium]
MAYDGKQMRLMGGVPGQQLFLYGGADGATEMTAAGYFTPAVEDYNLSTGDLILCVGGKPAAPKPLVYAAKVADGAASVSA